MAFDDVFGSGQDQLRQSLLSQYQPNDSEPFSVEPRVLSDRLARKLAMRPTRDANVDFNVAPEKPEPKAPDLSRFGTPVQDEVPPEPSRADLSQFGTPVDPPAAEPPMTIRREGAAALKGIPHGAISSAGGVLKGAAATLENGREATAEGAPVNPMGDFTGVNIPASAAVPAKPLKERELYKAGQATQDFAQTVAPMSDQEKESIGGRVGMGAGAIAPYAAATLLAGPLAGLSAAAAGMGLDTYGQTYEKAKEHGADEETARRVALDAAGVAGVLGSLPLGAGKLAKGLLAKMGTSGIAFAGAGEMQEYLLQQIEKTYDPKAGYSADAKRIIAALILGAGMGGLHHAFEPGQQPQPQQPPGAQPGQAPGGALPGGGPQPGPGAGPQPGTGPQPGPNARNNQSGPNPGAGPQGGPGPQPNTGGPGQQQAPPGAGAGPQPGKPPPGTGTGKAGDPNYTMDAQTRAKMERVYRHFEQGKDPSKMTDGELFDAVNEHLRDTSSTGHTAKPETPEEAAAREQAATDRDQRDILKKAGWTDAHVNAMTPEQREQYVARAQGKAAPEAERPQNTTARENATKQQGTATNTGPDKVVPEAASASNPVEKINTPDKAGVNPPDNAPVNPTPGRRDAPIKAVTASDILDAQPAEPKSPEQASAENYKHAHVEIDHLGLTGRNSISIETGVGQERKGTAPDGKEWSVTMPVAYGRIKGTKGGDGQPLDIFVGPDPTSAHVFVVDQHHGDGGGWDEHKILAGFPGPDAALRAYADSYNDKGGDRIGHVAAFTPDQFKDWLKTDTTKPLKPEAAGSTTHHDPEPALTNPESHHASGAAERANRTQGAAPLPESSSPDLTKAPDSDAVKTSGDERGQPIVGTGTILRTKSGRETAPAPRIDATTERKTKKAQFNLDKWLIDEARKEVAGDDHQTTLLKGMNPKNMSPADRDHLNLVLFGDHEGPRPSDVVDKTKRPTPSQARELNKPGETNHEPRQSTRNDQHRGISPLEQDQGAVQQPESDSVQGLRGARNKGVSGVGGELPEVSGRRGSSAASEPNLGSDRQQSRVRAGQHEVDGSVRPNAELSKQPSGDIEGRANGRDEGGAHSRNQTQNASEATSGGNGRNKGTNDASERLGAGAGERPARATEPLNLLQFIASRGGLKPHPELAVMDAHKHTVAMGGFPYRRKLVRDGGMDLDRAREAAEEAGYFRGSADGTSTITEFLDAIDDGIRGNHRYPEGHEGTKTKTELATRDEREAHEEAQVQEWSDAIERTGAGGTHMAPEIKTRALELMRTTDLDAPEAVETAIMQLTAEEKGVQAEFYDTYGHEVDDEIYAQAASGYGENLAREGASGDGHQEVAPSGPRPGDAVAGEQGRDRRDDAGSTKPDAGREHADTIGDAADTGGKGSAENHADAERPERGVEPLVVYHGSTNKNFTEFGPAQVTKRGPNGDHPGIYFTSDAKAASQYARGGKVIAAHLDLKNPLDTTALIKKGQKRGLSFGDAKREALKSLTPEHDGIVFKGNGVNPPEYVAFKPEQVRVVSAPETKTKKEPVATKRKSFDDMTKAEKKAERDAPTWAEILRELPMHKDGHTRQHEIVFDLMKDMAGVTKYNDLTPEQKHELLAKLKAEKPAPTTETGADNKPQMVMPGAEKASDGTMAKRAAAAPLKPKVAQKVADDGLFGDGHKQGDLLDAPPLKKPAPVKDAFDDIFDGAIDKLPDLNIDDVAKGLGKLFGGLSQPKPAFGGREIGRNADGFMVHEDENGVRSYFDTKEGLREYESRVMGPDGQWLPSNPSKRSKRFTPVDGFAEPEAPFLDEEKYQAALPFFKAGVKHFAAGNADLPTMVNSLVQHLFAAGMDKDAIRAMKPYIKRFTDDVTAGRETINAPSRSDILESDRGEPKTGDGVGKADVPAAAGAVGQGAGKRGSETDAGDQRPADSERVSQDHAPAVGARGNLELPHREPVDESGDTADRERQRSGADREGGFSFDDGTTDEAVRNAQKDADLNARRERQRKAEGVKVIPGDIANIADTLPMLFPEQHADVKAAEDRFGSGSNMVSKGHGMLFTNGTGTGKTYSGLGVIKRFAMQGKTNALVIAPSQGILMDWVRSAKDLGLDMKVLDSTVDNGGKGLVGTTYANLGDNKHLADREWDLIVPDEAHKLSSDKDGTTTKALKTMRALTKHPDGLFDRAKMVLRKDWDAIDFLPESSRPAAYAEFQKQAKPLIDKWQGEPRAKALMMSATPFAYHFSLDYANGYLFEYDKDRSGSRYNSGDGRDAFFMQHLGYRMRTNRLTKPDADVKSEVMERQLHEYLKKQGSLSGRALTVDKDYDRKFVLAHDAVGEQIDRALNFLQEAEDGRYRPLYDVISKQFDYLTRMRLLEAIKARAAVPYIQENLDLGRKIVVFHDYNEGGGINPFDLAIPPDTKTTTYSDGKHVEVSVNDMYDDFRAQNPYINDLKFASYLPPIAELTKSFPDAMVYNGTVSNKIRNEAKRLFNDDNSKRDIIIVQSAAGEAGISLHDTTGKRQRVLLNLGMPIRPTSSIQQEGRIYRIGQSSDAIFRYMNTGTDWERWTFAGKIAERAGTAENLALGDQARTIRQSFIDAFSNAGDYAPAHGEGKGGKEADRAISHSVSEFDKAKTHYFANGKTSGRRDQREGTDYYATPEPVGLKMVEFAGVKSGEKILEPSAGHGAIARYFPEDTARTLVEPSSSLASRAALNTPGARVVVDRFENLDKGANKFDAIIMNPPFGHGGATAIEHVSKAIGHLKNGGRIVALIPRGSTDAKFNKLMDSPASKDVYLVGDINLPPVTFERAGTSISARIVVLEKQTDQEVRAKLQSKSRDYSDVTKIGELFDRIENAVLPDRLEPKTKDIDVPTEGKVTVGGVDFSLETSSDKMRHSATLKSFLGMERFRTVVRAAEDAGGEYIKTAKSFRFKSEAERQKFLDVIANPPAAPEAPSAPSGVTFKTGETIHAKTRAKLFVATANERVAGDVYSQMNAVAKANGGYYSSFKGNGAIPGFQFKSAEERQKFLDQMGGKKPDGGGPGGGLAQPDGPRLDRQLGGIAQQQVLERGRATDSEHLVAYDANGSATEIKGTERRIELTPELFDRLLDPNEHIVTHHNHPEGVSFSHDDIAITSLPGAGETWAHGHNGNIYRVEVTPAGKAMLPAQWMPRSEKIEKLMDVIQHSIMVPIGKAFEERRVGAAEGNLAVPHLVNVVLRDAGFIDYQTNFDDAAFRAKVPGLDENIAKAVEIIRKQVLNARVHDRPARTVRHPGSVGAVFDRGAVARPVAESRRGNPQSGANDQGEAGRGEPGLSQPSNAFKKPGSTDVALADILRTRLLGRLGDLNATEARTQLQDKFARVKNAEESVGAPSSQSAHQAESLYYGRTGQRLEALTEHHIDPLIREMKARDIDLDSLDDFLYARHAPERNQKLGRMYANDPTHDFYRAVHDPDVVGASGMSTNDALGVIRAARSAGKLQDYLAVARMVDALNARTRRALFDAGLIDRDTFDAWNSGYKYYVPLRGHAEGDQFMASGSGMNVRGKEAKAAFGRRSKADSPVAYSIMQAEMAIVRAEKNRVGNTFLQFVRANPDPARWTIDRPPLVKRIDPTTGLVTSVPDNLYANRDNVFTTKIDGRDVHVTLHGPDGLNLARALKNMGTANVHKLIRAYSAITHTMAKLATSWNPEFMIPNFARDLGEAFINLQAQEQRGFVRNFVKHIPGAMRGSMAAIAGRTPPPGSSLARYVDAFHRFDKAGGRVRFFGIDDPDQIETNVTRKLKRLEGGPVNTIKDIGDKAARALEIAGGGIENATRLSAFMAAEDAGISTADAAMLARNLTVDFNKKGELGGAFSALYMFANAGVQGQARMVRALGNRRVWQAVGALAAAAALSTLYSILASDVDETGIPDYMKIPKWERDKNLIFTLPGHHYLKVPLPYGFSPFAVIGSHSVSVAMGHEKPGKAAHAIMDSIVSAFNPLGEESSMWMDIVPSALRPAFHIQFNKNWTDKPLYPEQDKNRGNRPDSTQAFKSNSAFSKEAAKQLNAWSGGNSYQPGAIDVHPASIDHVLQAITGGVGRFVKGTVDSLYQNLSGGEWQPEKAPIVRRFIGKVGPEADAALYYEKRQESLDEKAGINAARKDMKAGKNTDEASQFLSEQQTSRASIFKSADERVKALRARKDLTEPELREQIRGVQNKARAQVQRLQPSP